MLVIASGFALGCGEADTVYPGDESFYNTTPPVGVVTTMTATITGVPSVVNPYIKISFDTPVNSASIVYNTTLSVILDPLTVPVTLTQGTDYFGIINTSNISIDLSPTALSGHTVRLVLTSGINAYSNTSLSLSNPGNFDWSL